jgi:secreted PhoX family phosphatase
MSAASRVSDHLGRRSFLKSGLAVAGGVTLSGPFTMLGLGAASGAPTRGDGYGPLSPVNDMTTGLPLLMLPKGFEYLSFGWTGDPMVDGAPTPSTHDGMGAFRHGDRVHLVRNHERSAGSLIGGGAIPAYDASAGGGNTTVIFDPDAGQYIETHPSLAGTIRNCAGGVTPWGTWLSCEENTGLTPKRHGYTFEVPSDGSASNAVPLIAMGRFNKEAHAVDANGVVYQTEDSTPGGFYRFVPTTPGNLAAGGALEMLKVTDVFRANLRGAVGTGTTYPVEWVPIAEPDPDSGSGVRSQGLALGAAEFARPEGVWYGNGVIYFACTSGGAFGQGQIFAYDPDLLTLTCVFESPAADVLNAPDNICVSPRGGIVICEDGSGNEFLHGLSTDGTIFPFAMNNVDLRSTPVKGFSSDSRGSEWAGACFDAGGGGNWLFANIQSPGITFAITGPWRQGIL